MTSIKKRLDKKNSFLAGIGLLFCVIISSMVLTVKGNDDFDLARQEILLRNIGHELLLRSGDSTSRVLPVKKLSENEYQIRFENDFTFQTDSLVKIVRRSLAANHSADNYIVRVLNCSGKDVVFGYAIFRKEGKNIVPCSGRAQPKGCYLIDLTFQKPATTISQQTILLAGLPLLAFAGLLMVRPFRSRKNKIDAVTDQPGFPMGNSVFDAEKKQVITGGLVTELTPKENKLLLIFAQAPNSIIERSRIQKEIWEDEGVIVGRSLDVFISKLRKKLENDPSIQLVNIHGKGYKLEIRELPMA